MLLKPTVYQVQAIEHENHDTFNLILKNEHGVVFAPGQFNMLYQFGIGEVAISISGDPRDPDGLIHTIRSVGSVTKSMQQLKPVDEISVRGPFGNSWPLEKKGGDLLIVTGGIGMAAFRSLLYVLGEKVHEYRKITLLYGAKTFDDLIYQKEMEVWRKQGIEIELTLDQAHPLWQGSVGVVTKLIARHLSHPQETVVFMCGPEIMMDYAVKELTHAGVSEHDIYLSMERNMQCAVGFCGRCQYSPYFICKDGPIFSYAKLKPLLAVKEL